MKNDIAFEIGAFIPGSEDYFDEWEVLARQYREIEVAVGRARLNSAYGQGERHKFDLFHPSGAAEGLVVFVHGGYWMRFDRSFWSHFSAGLTARGWAVAMPSYTLAPQARIGEITLEVARAIETAAGIIAGPIRLAGHSAGGHLVARMACKDIALDADTRARIERIIPISPVADLRGLLETTRNETLRLDKAEANRESPLLHDPLPTPVTIWAGAEERPVFIEQAIALEAAWPKATLRIAAGRHHIDILSDLGKADSPLVNSILA